jgi:hypothetical protein
MPPARCCGGVEAGLGGQKSCEFADLAAGIVNPAINAVIMPADSLIETSPAAFT